MKLSLRVDCTIALYFFRFSLPSFHFSHSNQFIFTVLFSFSSGDIKSHHKSRSLFITEAIFTNSMSFAAFFESHIYL